MKKQNVSLPPMRLKLKKSTVLHLTPIQAHSVKGGDDTKTVLQPKPTVPPPQPPPVPPADPVPETRDSRVQGNTCTVAGN